MSNLTPDSISNKSKKLIGTVDWFNEKMGYGFIKMEDGQDIFVHYSAIQTRESNAHKTLLKGDKVQFYVVDGKKGPQASIVEVISEAELHLEHISAGLKIGEFDAIATFHNLKSIIENSEIDAERIRALKYMNNLSLKNRIYYKYLENLAISDINKAIREFSIRIIIDNFCREGEKVIRWVFEHEKSADSLLSIYNSLKGLDNPNSRDLVELMEKTIGKKYIEKYQLNPIEAMAIKLFELFFFDCFGYNRNYLELYDDRISWTYGHSHIIFYIKDSHVDRIHSHTFSLDFSIIKFFKNLRSLEFYYVEDHYLKEIDAFSNLEILEFRYSKFEKDEFKPPPSLKELSFNGTPIDDLSIVQDLTNLEKLSIAAIDDADLYNKMYEIKGLEKLIRLRELKLEGCLLEEIRGLEKLTNLEVLDLSHNNLKEIKGLNTLVNLKKLVLCNNQITEVKGLSSLLNLEYLNLEENQITEIADLEKLRNLEYLNLRVNQIKEFTGVEKLTNLKMFLIYSNEITEAKIAELCEKIPDIKFTELWSYKPSS